MVDIDTLISLSVKLGTILKSKNKKIAFAESCTGGLLSSLITEVPGSSEYFDRGFVTYSNESKMEILGVTKEIIERYGAVSYECAKAMVEGLRRISKCDVCVAITGIAGPTGGTPDKPVGLVFMSFSIDGNVYIEKHIFKGTRREIRLSTVEFVFNFLIKNLSK
jgi:PncC family amidohydrolase